MVEEKKLPEEGELVIAVVKKIFDYGAVCELLEYNNLQVLLPIREVASGWVKNIHEFLHEGQRIVCKVYHVNEQMKSVDVTLKRVTEIEKRKKLEEYNAEKRAEKFLEAIAKKLEKEEELEKTKEEILKNYSSLYELFNDAYKKTKKFEELKIEEGIKKEIEEKASEVIEEKRYELVFKLKMQTFDTKEGIEKLNKAIEFLKKKKFEVTYISAPFYQISIVTHEPQKVEKEIPKIIEKIKKEIDVVEIEKIKK
ncbi:MAG: S1 RNA-binding domain-containing protein [Candidatus Micrarchaeia archaeon]